MNNTYLHLLKRASPLLLPLALAISLIGLIESALAGPRPGNLTRITSASELDRDSGYPSLSEDGTVIAFESDSDLLGEGIDYYQHEIWLYDTTTLTYTRVTSASDPAKRDSYAPSLSDDGTVVAFYGDSDLLGEGIADEQSEIWLYDAKAMTYTRVTSASDSSRYSYLPSLSGDGTVVGFYSNSDLLNEGRPYTVLEIWLFDTATMTYTRVTSASHSNRDSVNPSLNRDGTVVAFQSDSDLMNEGIADGQDEIWLYDTETLTFTRVTSATDNERYSREPSLSGDGTVVAFESNSDLLNEGHASAWTEIWLYDTEVLTFSQVTSTREESRECGRPSLSDDGTVVAFYSDADFLDEGRPEGVHEIWLYDRTTLTYTRVTSASHAGRNSLNPSLSGDGRVIAFQSDSDFLNEGIPDSQGHIWLWRTFRIYLPLVLRG